MFWINVPIIGIALLLLKTLDRDVIDKNKVIRIPVYVISFFIVSIISVVLFFIQVGNDYPFTHIVYLLIIGLIALILALFFNYKNKGTVIPYRSIKSKIIYILFFGMSVFGFIMMAIMIIMPFLFTNVILLPPYQIGLITLFFPIGVLISSKFSAHVMKIIPAPYIVSGVLGITVLWMVVMMIILHTILSIELIIVMLFILGLLMGQFMPVNIYSIMTLTLQNAHGRIGALNRLVQNFGIILGSVIPLIFLHRF